MDHRVLLIALVLAGLLAPVAARASDPLVVFAGATQRVEVDTPFFLEAQVDDAAEPLTFAWDAPAGCLIDDPSSRITTASCSQTGTHWFTIDVAAPDASGSDAVGIVVVRPFSFRIDETGDVLVGLPDEFTGSGDIDGATAVIPFEVPADTAALDATLNWGLTVNDIDLVLRDPEGGNWAFPHGRTLTEKPRRVQVDRPVGGTWEALVQPRISGPDTWRLMIAGAGATGDTPVPSVEVDRAVASPGEQVTLRARAMGGTPPLRIDWEAETGSFAFDDATGETFSFTFTEDVAIKARVTDAHGLTALSTIFVREHGRVPDKPFTVVAVIDWGFSPYHYDFVAHQHPWNLDGDPETDFAFLSHPATYIEGYPADAEAIALTIPADPNETISDRAAIDAEAWESLERSRLQDVRLHWFPGTKVIGAVAFEPGFLGSNSAHGTRSAASAAGNIHGTCPECVFVLIQGAGGGAALRWVASQPWIDAVNNSYGHCLGACVLRSGVYLNSPTAATRAASERGQSIMFSAGNGLANAYDVPQLTYTSSEQGPDWMVTVGANAPSNDQNYLGSGKPADISSVGASYPSTGGSTATGTGTHSGTSNAGPVVVGTFAKVLHETREVLGHRGAGNQGGVVATGTPAACGEAVPSCALGDGVLTRAEWWDLVFHNVLPAPARTAVGNQIPTTEYAYYYQGHGAVIGRLRGDDTWNEEWGRMLAHAHGEVAAYDRPPGERNWMTVDSKCRQRFWGSWSGGYYTGVEPALDPVADPIASLYDTWCSPMPPGTLGPD